MGQIIQNYLHAFSNLVHSFHFIDGIDILLLTYLIYLVLKMVRETRAGQLLKGIGLLIVAYFFSGFVGLRAINLIIGELLSVGLLAVLILFQPELRRALEKFGLNVKHILHLPTMTEDTRENWLNAIPIICDAAQELSKTTTGALIVIERGTKLGEQIDNGTIVNAVPSVELFGTIFFPKTPLHDGAVIMRDGMIHAGACFLPKPQKEESIDKHLGSRHRAAIGMSENSDAVIIVVSEETGQISVAENGTLTRDYTRDSLAEYLHSVLILPDEEAATWKARAWKKVRSLASRMKKKEATKK